MLLHTQEAARPATTRSSNNHRRNAAATLLIKYSFCPAADNGSWFIFSPRRFLDANIMTVEGRNKMRDGICRDFPACLLRRWQSCWWWLRRSPLIWYCKHEHQWELLSYQQLPESTRSAQRHLDGPAIAQLDAGAQRDVCQSHPTAAEDTHTHARTLRWLNYLKVEEWRT